MAWQLPEFATVVVVAIMIIATIGVCCDSDNHNYLSSLRLFLSQQNFIVVICYGLAQRNATCCYIPNSVATTYAVAFGIRISQRNATHCYIPNLVGTEHGTAICCKGIATKWGLSLHCYMLQNDKMVVVAI